MCKEDWLVGLGQEGVVWGWGELTEVPWGGGAEKRGGETKILKRGGGKLHQEVNTLKKEGLEPPYELLNQLNFLTWYISRT